MNNTKSEGVRWRRFGHMVKDTTDTLGGMHRIEITNHDGRTIPFGEAVAFAYTAEQADRIAHAVNCHDALLEACKVASEMFDDSMFVWGSDDEAKVSKMLKQLRAAITRATTQKEGAK